MQTPIGGQNLYWFIVDFTAFLDIKIMSVELLKPSEFTKDVLYVYVLLHSCLHFLLHL